MALPASPNAISLSQVQTEFGGSNPIAISEYYSAASGVPTSGTISLSHFHGKSSVLAPISGTTYQYLYNDGAIVPNTSNVILVRNYPYQSSASGSITIECQAVGYTVTSRTTTWYSRTIYWYKNGAEVLSVSNIAGPAGSTFSSIVSLDISVAPSDVFAVYGSGSFYSSTSTHYHYHWIKTGNNIGTTGYF